MDPQTAYPHQEDPNNAGMHSGEEEPHHEKQSVMKRVKAKAKKIKHSLTSHGHAPDEHDDHSGEHDEEDDEDEEMAEDPEIHDAPINDSPATKTAPTWGEENLAKAKDTLEMPAVKEEHPQAPVNTSAHSLSPGIHPTRPHGTPVDFAIPQTRSHAPANTTADSFSTGTHPTRPPGIPADPVYETHAPVNPSTHTSVPGIHQTGVPDLPSNVDRGQGIAVDPSAPKDRHETHTPSNYQSKVVDPVGAGGEEVGITPIIHSFGKMNVHGESEPKTEHHLPTGTHDQFSSEGHEPLTRSEKQQYKLSSANSAIDKAATARNVPASKLGHASQDPINKSEEQGYDNRDMPQNQSNAGNAPSATSTIAEKAASLKNVVSSKLGYGGQEPIKNSEEQQHENRGYTPGNESHEPINKSEEQSFDSRADKPQNQSTYTGKLSSAAVSAKNVVASKLGYGAKEETHAAPDMHERDVHGDNETAKSPQAGGYGSKIASTLAPVYGKVSGAGSAVMSKLPGTGRGSGTGTGTETNKEGGVVGSDKGASVKEYLVEKSRPGEEDRALSQIITDVLGSKRKEENVEPTGTARRPSREVLSDAIHNRKEESEPGKSSLPMGKVTESEEVKKQLGPGDEDTQNKVALESGKPGEGVVDRLKGAVTSWFGKGGEPQPSEASHDSSHEGTGAFLDTRSGGGEVQGQGHEVVGEGRHEESSK